MTDGHPALTGPAGRAHRGTRLRWASRGDSERLHALFCEVRPGEQKEAPADLEEWLEHGGAILPEDEEGRLLSAVRWLDTPEGWLLDRICTREAARGLGFGRWLMTKVEALAIRHNVPLLTVRLPGAEENSYYERLGYLVSRNGSGYIASKQVGGQWQLRRDDRA